MMLPMHSNYCEVCMNRVYDGEVIFIFVVMPLVGMLAGLAVWGLVKAITYLVTHLVWV